MARVKVALDVGADGRARVRLLGRGHGSPWPLPRSPLPTHTSSPPQTLGGLGEEEAYDPSRPPAVRELVFIVHGIGRHDDFDEDKCTSWDGTAGLRTGGNLEFRRTVRRLLDDHFSQLPVHLEVRAIEWHSRLRAHGLNELFAALTTMPAGAVSDMRHFAGEYLMDVLYYVQPTYGQMILDDVAAQLNSRYADFIGEHPYFRGGVSIIGHSLGSMIIYDLLGGGDGAGRGYRPPTFRRPPLLFEVNNFFAIGSPIAAFLISRGCLPPPAQPAQPRAAPPPPATPAASAVPPGGSVGSSPQRPSEGGSPATVRSDEGGKGDAAANGHGDGDGEDEEAGGKGAYAGGNAGGVPPSGSQELLPWPPPRAAATPPRPAQPQPQQPQPQPQLAPLPPLPALPALRSLPTSDLLGSTALLGFDAYRHALQPRCAHFWSIYHAIDPVAQRLEPLMRSAPPDGGWPADEASKVGRVRLPKSAAPSGALLEMLVAAVAVNRRPLSQRVDWCLPKQSNWVSDNLFALPAHSSYWASSEAVLFVLCQICLPIGRWLEEQARDRALNGMLPRALAATCSTAAASAPAPPSAAPPTPSAAGGAGGSAAAPEPAAGGGGGDDDEAAGTLALSLDGASLASLLPSSPAPFDHSEPLTLCCRMLLHDTLTGFWTDHLAICQGGLLRLFDPAVVPLVSRKGAIDLRSAEVSVGSDVSAAASASAAFGYGAAAPVSSLHVHAQDRAGRDRTYEMACANAAEADAWFSACKEAQAAYAARRRARARARRGAGGEAARGADGADADADAGADGAEEDEAAVVAGGASAEAGGAAATGSGGWTEHFFGVRKSGWMRKRGHPSSVLVSVSWASRWFCLSDSRCSLEYFDREPEWLRRPDVKALPLRNCRIELVDDVLAVRIADGRGTSTLLRANTPADFERWAPLAHARVPTAALPHAPAARVGGAPNGTVGLGAGLGAGGFGGGFGGGGNGPCAFAAAAGASAFTSAAEHLAGHGDADARAAGAATGWATLSRISRGAGAFGGAGGGGAAGGAPGACAEEGAGVGAGLESLARQGSLPQRVSVDGYKVLSDAKGKQYVVFVARAVSADGSTYLAHRRFSEFQALHAQLQASLPAGMAPPPPLPPTHFWNRFEPSYLQEKGVRLAEYLNRLCARCFVDVPRADTWVEPLLRFLAMPSALSPVAEPPMTPSSIRSRVTESDGPEAPSTP